jgi:hypothetical protein
MIAHRSRNTNPTRRTFSLKPSGHIYRVTVQVSSIGNRVAKVDPYAKPNGSIAGLVAIVNWDLSLYLHRAPNGPIDAIEDD